MGWYRRGSSVKGVKGAKRAYRAKRTRVAKVAVRKIVKQVIRRQQEVKDAPSYQQLNQSCQPYDSGASQAPTVWNVANSLGSITVGAGQGQRIGNEISIRSFTVRGVLRWFQISPSSLVHLPMYCKMFIGRKKIDQLAPTFTDFGALFQLGSATQAPAGTSMDMFMPINRDVFDIFYQKVYKLGIFNSQQLGPTVTSQNNDFPSNRFYKINLLKHLAKTIHYNDTVAAPSNRLAYLYMWVLPCYADGTVCNNASYLINGQVINSFVADIKYTDD